MKRNLKHAIIAIVAAIGLVACTPDDPDPIIPIDPIDPIIPINPTNPEEPRLATATVETISGYPTSWEKDSKFIVGYSSNGTDQTIELKLSEGDGTSTGKFTYDIEGELPTPSYAIFPTSLVTKTGASITDCSFVWPTEQKYDGPNIHYVPMWAEGIVDSNLNGPYSFHSLGGILHVSVTGRGSISKVRLISDKPLSGVFQLDVLGNVKFDEGSKSVYFNIDMEARGNMNLSDNATEFYFSMPAGRYYDLTVEFGGEAGTSCSYKFEELVEVSKGKLTSVKIDGIKGYGAGKLLRVDSEHDITYDSIKAAIQDMMPQLKTFSSIFDAAIKPFIANRTRIARIIYLTPDRDGNLIEASGLVACQYDKKPYDNRYDKIVSIQHGTCDIAKAPSYQDFYPEIAPATIKGSPNIIVMADYLGYGASQTADLQHPYLCKELTASCCADMLSAAEEFINVTGINLRSDKIDLIGYSQGGAATMATLLELENRKVYDKRINEVWAGAGPYDILGFFDSFKQKETYDKTGFVPYTFRGIIYGEHLKVDYANIFNPSLIANVDLETLFSTKQVNEWHSVIGYDIKDILHPDFYKDNYGGNADLLTLVAALKKNSIVNFSAPKNLGKVKFYHSATDDTVPYSCSEALQKAWNFSEIIQLQAKNNHLLGGIEFLLDYCGLETMAAIIIPLIN